MHIHEFVGHVRLRGCFQTFVGHVRLQRCCACVLFVAVAWPQFAVLWALCSSGFVCKAERLTSMKMNTPMHCLEGILPPGVDEQQMHWLTEWIPN